MTKNYDQMAEEIRQQFRDAPHVGIIGSVSLRHPDSRETCCEIGRALAGIPDLVVVTGGADGAADLIARAYDDACRDAGRKGRVLHILPEGSGTREYGDIIHAGADAEQRREVLGRTASMFIVVEGSPGTVHETEIAVAHQALLLPIGRLGGHAADIYSWQGCPENMDSASWFTLGSDTASHKDVAQAVCLAVESMQLIPA